MKFISLALLVFSTLALAQAPGQGPGQGPDPFGNFFQPDVIMSHQKEIGLTETQRDNLIKILQKDQSATIEPSFRVKSAAEELGEIIGKPHVDEEKAIAALQKLTKHEIELKTAMVRMMVRIKNILTPEQQQKLRALGK